MSKVSEHHCTEDANMVLRAEEHESEQGVPGLLFTIPQLADDEGVMLDVDALKELREFIDDRIVLLAKPGA